jgi:hypothetical protein
MSAGVFIWPYELRDIRRDPARLNGQNRRDHDTDG